jgi:Zn-dependent peptidase ImmA (M78 family)
MDLNDILKLNRLQCTGEIARAGWIVDQDAVVDALSLLDIKLIVHIRFMTGIYRRGTHRNNYDRHKITLDQNRSMEDSNFTLWHELTHCMQSERWHRENPDKSIMNWHADYKRNRGSYGESYEGNLYELEANRVAAKNEEMMLLARTN